MREYNYFLNIAWTLLEIFSIFMFGRMVLGVRPERKKWFWLIVISFTAICFVIPHDAGWEKIAMIGMFYCFLFQGGMAQKVCTAVCAGSVVFFVPFFQSCGFVCPNMGNGSALYASKIVIEIIILSGMGIALWEKGKIPDNGNIGWIFALSWIAAFYILGETETFFTKTGMWRNESSYPLAAGMAGIFASNILLFVFYIRQIYQMRQMKEMAVFQKANELEQKHYEKLEEVYGNFRSLSHDMNRYLSALTVIGTESQEAETLTGEIRGRIAAADRKIYCSRPVLNALLNENMEKAEKKQLKFKLFAEPGFDLEMLDDYALIGIIGNLLDNAMEAAEQSGVGGWISAELFSVNDGKQRFFRIANSTKDGEKLKNSHFLTSKKNRQVHGYGLSNVKKIVEENRGLINIKTETGTVTVEAIFPVQISEENIRT